MLQKSPTFSAKEPYTFYKGALYRIQKSPAYTKEPYKSSTSYTKEPCPAKESQIFYTNTKELYVHKRALQELYIGYKRALHIQKSPA